jgi:hypothetical protein
MFLTGDVVCFGGLELLGLKGGCRLLRRMGKGLYIRSGLGWEGVLDLQVEVDANLIAAGFDGPAFGNAALREVIDRDAMVV